MIKDSKNCYIALEKQRPSISRNISKGANTSSKRNIRLEMMHYKLKTALPVDTDSG